MTPEPSLPRAAQSRAFERVTGVRSIAFRTTARILLFGGVVGAAVAIGSAAMVEYRERARLEHALVEVMATVERTASVAAFARDEQLAGEVVSGLVQNRSVSYAAIEDGGEVLASAGRAPARGQVVDPALSRALNSPFAETEVVGRLRVAPAAEFIAEQAAVYSRLIAAQLAVLVVCITLGVAWLVRRGVTLGIRSLSNGLHGLDVVAGTKVEVPVGHSDDELGRLAIDINELLERMDAALARERALQGLHAAAERKWRLIFDNAESGLFTLDAEGRLAEWNPALARALALPEGAKAGGGGCLSARLVDTEGGIARMLEEIAEGREMAEADFECCNAVGEMRWLHIVLNPLDGAAGMLQGIANDVTERRRAEARALEQAERDALTGLLNRRGMELAYARRGPEYAGTAGLGLLLVDLDGFKWVNDNHGHEAGDELLELVARRIEGVVRRSDKVARIGGDEFVLLLENLKSMSMASYIAGKLVDVIGQPCTVLDDVKVRIGASVGVVFTQYPPEEIAELLRRADAAMYEAKRAGKSQYRLAFPV